VQRSRAVHRSQYRGSNSLGQLSEDLCSEATQVTAHSGETATHLDSWARSRAAKSCSAPLTVQRQQFTWTAEWGFVQRSRTGHSSQWRDSNSLGQLSEESCSEVVQCTTYSTETAIHLDSWMRICAAKSRRSQLTVERQQLT